eukprot:CAMPEP_0172549006 /NCGR_PEP_ID=MMETSP1067-20121228/18186_1 /TAXON_ID=265564 ORGANISM="Thalassiosira punctigera, Strain Tpunct2005C2" /NCGR_SAMPLE_ID=MMETSP1067 /ASSEMBLY_ACC=CAM_ASM_000444 /LENGTH=251 /DNA_ID=CAMNT_0013336317 /DNA_START=204 /DNA_END=959 /DNA_ORIENTATION=+
MVSGTGNFSPFLLLILGAALDGSECFVSVAPTVIRPSLRTSSPFQQTASFLEQDEFYATSFDIIDNCAAAGQHSDELYDAVRYIDRNASKLYPDESAKEELWDRAHGSWKLQLATGGGRYTTFKPVPIFAYAMIDDTCFGNGVGLNQETIILSLLGPHYFNAKRRQMGIGIEDVYLFSNEVTQLAPGFITDGMGLGKTPEDYRESKSRMPTFTIIGASDKSLIARGGSGGIAIWTRLEKDIRPAAYGTAQI